MEKTDIALTGKEVISRFDAVILDEVHEHVARFFLNRRIVKDFAQLLVAGVIVENRLVRCRGLRICHFLASLDESQTRMALNWAWTHDWKCSSHLSVVCQCANGNCLP